MPNSTNRRALTAGVLLLATTLLPRLAIADVKTIGPLSFAVPDGWKDETSAPDRAEMVWQNSNGAYLIILLTAPQPSSGAADRDFAIAWRTLVESDPRLSLPSPIYDVRGSVGYAAKWSGGAVANRTREIALYILQPSVATFVPVVVVGPNRAVLDALYETVRMVIGSVRIAPLRAAPIKTTIGVADLVGDWKTGGASVVSYVNGMDRHLRRHVGDVCRGLLFHRSRRTVQLQVSGSVRRKRGPRGGGGNGRVQRRVGRVPRAAERQAHALPLRVLRAGPHRGHADDAPSGSVRGHGFQHCALCGAVRPRGAREVAKSSTTCRERRRLSLTNQREFRK